jgi:hypothetical protein
LQSGVSPDYLVIIARKEKYLYYLPDRGERFRILREMFPGKFKVVYEYRGRRIYVCNDNLSRGIRSDHL